MGDGADVRGPRVSEKPSAREVSGCQWAPPVGAGARQSAGFFWATRVESLGMGRAEGKTAHAQVCYSFSLFFYSILFSI